MVASGEWLSTGLWHRHLKYLVSSNAVFKAFEITFYHFLGWVKLSKKYKLFSYLGTSYSIFGRQQKGTYLKVKIALSLCVFNFCVLQKLSQLLQAKNIILHLVAKHIIMGGHSSLSGHRVQLLLPTQSLKLKRRLKGSYNWGSHAPILTLESSSSRNEARELEFERELSSGQSQMYVTNRNHLCKRSPLRQHLSVQRTSHSPPLSQRIPVQDPCLGHCLLCSIRIKAGWNPLNEEVPLTAELATEIELLLIFKGQLLGYGCWNNIRALLMWSLPPEPHMELSRVLMRFASQLRPSLKTELQPHFPLVFQP